MAAISYFNWTVCYSTSPRMWPRLCPRPIPSRGPRTLCLQVLPAADFSALLEDAVTQATAQLTSGNNSHADVTAVVKVADKLAMDGATRQLSLDTNTPASSSEAPAGSGLVILLISALSVAKAGKLLA